MVLYLLFAKSCELFIFHFISFCFVLFCFVLFFLGGGGEGGVKITFL